VGALVYEYKYEYGTVVGKGGEVERSCFCGVGILRAKL
jgi:hypothetical protein